MVNGTPRIWGVTPGAQMRKSHVAQFGSSELKLRRNHAAQSKGDTELKLRRNHATHSKADTELRLRRNQAAQSKGDTELRLLRSHTSPFKRTMRLASESPVTRPSKCHVAPLAARIIEFSSFRSHKRDEKGKKT